MRSGLEPHQTAERYLLAYKLYALRHAGFYRTKARYIARNITIRSPSAKAFLKLTQLLGDFPDPEGYVRAAFTVFPDPYPNMLLSEKVKKAYDQLNERWLKDLQDAIHIQAQRWQAVLPAIKRGEKEARLAIAWMIGDCHPIFRIYLKWKLHLPIRYPDAYRACYEYRLWPYGYERCPAWEPILSVIQTDICRGLLKKIEQEVLYARPVHYPPPDDVCHLGSGQE